MESGELVAGFSFVVANAAPIVIAVVGETLSERSGVINLSLNGLILLAAVAGFAAASATGSVWAGMAAGAGVGVSVSFVVAFAGITLGRSQVACGLVLAFLCRDLSYFLGNHYVGESGPVLGQLTIPFLSRIPFIGEVFFSHDAMTYLSYAIIFASWFFVYRTGPGLVLRGVGERPGAAYVRGVSVTRTRYFYTMLGGALVGLAGPVYSLCVKPGWKGSISGLDGIGWIALAITIFGGWNPVRAAVGVYLFTLLQWLGLVLQETLPNLPAQVLQVAPFPLMIFTLLIVNIGNTDWVFSRLAMLSPRMRHVIRRILKLCGASPPEGLGKPFDSGS